MSDLKHTPGPWRAYGKPFQRTSTLQAMSVICGNGPGDGGHQTATAMARTAEETEANAKLIAAAPELLEAIINLNSEVCKECNIGQDKNLLPLLGFVQDAIRAIKKATS